ncbi:MAG: hypothetical protein DME50_09855 [Verrucomicrobia bacterium]|nr:MAG: hypothetical protein DME85_08375 [Verrucomicrobiota bacterium]PYK65126.1 MAG: hypothetical protein DME50_09855 [Verrucomicrobiota bacterium]
MKSENAALGFRIKSGWATVVLLAGPVDSPRLRDNRVIELCDPRVPETRQPYHAAMGKLETDLRKINRRAHVVRSIAQQSIATLLVGYRREGYEIWRADLVVGSQIDPTSITNPHIRAHAFEGQLFRSVLEEALHAHRVRTQVLIEGDIYAKAAVQLKKSSAQLRHLIQTFGRFTEGPWRAEQKAAALAAWLALC